MLRKDKAKKKMSEEQINPTDNIADASQKAEETTENSADNKETSTGEENPDNIQPENQSNDELLSLQKQVDENKDKYLRLSAEFDNYRKRTLKEKMDLTKTAGEDILKGLLPVMDDFERGLKHIDEASDVDALKAGISLIYNKFKDYLSQKGIKEIEASNAVFDTDLHEAITKIPVPDMSGKVVDVVEKGYFLHDKIIRYAKVVVGE